MPLSYNIAVDCRTQQPHPGSLVCLRVFFNNGLPLTAWPPLHPDRRHRQDVASPARFPSPILDRLSLYLTQTFPPYPFRFLRKLETASLNRLPQELLKCAVPVVPLKKIPLPPIPFPVKYAPRAYGRTLRQAQGFSASEAI